jgi:DNA-binding XRE family transcriptional regulator
MGQTMPRGKPPNLKRRQQIAEFRTAGLSLTEIDRRLGVSRQSVHQHLQRSGQTILRPGIICCVCGRMLGSRLRSASERSPVSCTACLPPEATLGQRLRAYRMAAQLTPAELAARIGVVPARIYSWECDQKHPLPGNIARLGQVLGKACLRAL